MLTVSSTNLVLFKVPEEVHGEVELKEYKYKEKKGTVLITSTKTYRVLCRENSNALMVKEGNNMSEIHMCLECGPLKYTATDVLEMVPEIRMANVTDVQYYLSKDRLQSTLPMSEHEYSEILKTNRCIVLVREKKEYIGKAEIDVLLEVLLLTRSIIIGQDTTNSSNVKNDFKEILPLELYQLVEYLVENGVLNKQQLTKDLISLLKETSVTEECFIRAIKINGLSLEEQS